MSRGTKPDPTENCPVLRPPQQGGRQGCRRTQARQEDSDEEGHKRRAKKNAGDPDIVKSPSDHKEYRYIKLSNGLNALLISDLYMDDCNSSEASEEEDMSSDTDDGKDSSFEDEKYGNVEEFGEVLGGREATIEGYGGVLSGLGKKGKQKERRESRIKDENDDYEIYEQLVKKEEENKMDSTEKQSAAALAVGVGSFCDPDDLPGLAHFLEHMVFMGSQKYPDENGFDTFLKKHGGSDNASTDTERTVFHFDIQKKYFREALDRWAQFFIQPLMIKDAIDREVEAVDSEYQIARPSDANRRELLLGSLAKQGHPMRKFFWGNAETLKHSPKRNRINTYQRLRDFRTRHYSAHYMNLVVQSRETLDTLEKWVTEIFSQIPNNGLPKPTFGHLPQPFDTPAFHKLYKVVPVKEIHSLSISWSLPPQEKNYRTKPLHYLSWLVGHEGNGSVLSLLRKKFWALALFGGNGETGFEQNSTYSIFSISVTLTDEGFEHFYEVIHIIFQYLKMLRKHGPVERIWKDIQKIEGNEFCFQEQVDPLEYVENISEYMHIFQKEDFLIGDQLLIEYNAEVIADALNHLIPQKANFVFFSPYHEGKCPLKEKWFGTQYSATEIDAYWSTLWDTDFMLHPDLHLPEENQFIATDFTVKKSTEHKTEYPHKILDTKQGCLWYKKDNKFSVPKAFICFYLVTPVIQQSALNMVLFDTFVSTLSHNLAEPAYQADVAQMEYKIIAKEHGLVIRVKGFNHKLPLLFQLIIDHLSNLSVSPSAFQMIIEQLKKTYFNNLLKTDSLAKDLRLSILEHGRWSLVEKYQTISSGITIEDLQAFVTAFKSKLWVEGLVQGNFMSNEAKDFMNYIAGKLQFVPLIHPCPIQFRVIELPNTHILCKVKSLHAGDPNSDVTVYYQTGAKNLKDYSLTELLVMHMEEPCFDFLRTKNTLGYHVYPSTRNTSGILGFSVTVTTQATKYNTEFVDKKIEEFFVHFEEKLRKLTEDEFSAQVSALIKLKQTDDAHLGEEVDRNWNEVLTQQYVFDRLAREIVALKSFRKSHLLDWFLGFRGKNKRVLSTHVVGYGKQEGNTDFSRTYSVQGTFFGKTAELTFLPSSPLLNLPSVMDIRAFTSTLNVLPYHKILK
ncbi:nardilysinnardilysin-like [Podarcis lilfordi]|uniref:Nardilysinnardilysin-like n=1 Tax=Podarcis lilfordi TaxID=74358 RepID=A0AA35KKF4_9SAUR|nr:nardilysinnardilysin-like [Podarcis lilfordi]